MEIFTQIKADMIAALKDKRTEDKEVLSLVISKLKNKAIDMHVDILPDVESIAIIQKFIKELDDDIVNYEKANRPAVVLTLKRQQALIKTYLPEMLSEDEIRNIINGLDDKSIPSVMKFFKTNYAGKVDMKLVNQLAR